MKTYRFPYSISFVTSIKKTIFIYLSLVIFCISCTKKDIRKNDTNQVIKVISKYKNIEYLNFNFASDNRILVNHDEFNSEKDLKNAYKISDSDWRIIEHEFKKLDIESIDRVGSEYLFIMESFNGDFGGYLITERKFLNNSTDMKYIAFDRFVIKSIDKLEDDFYKVTGGW